MNKKEQSKNPTPDGITPFRHGDFDNTTAPNINPFEDILKETEKQRKEQLKQSVIMGITMLTMTFVAGILVGYFFFEAHIVERLNTQFEGMGMGLCNISSSYIQTNEYAHIFFENKSQLPKVS